jgi:integrase
VSGHLRQRGSAWELRYRAAGRVHTETFKGSRTGAKARLRELLVTVDRGEHVAPSKLTVAEHVQDRIVQWQTGGRISTRTAEQYGVLALRIERGLGTIPLQRLTTADVERWHTAMTAQGLATRSARIAHGLLVTALRDGVRHNLIPRNAALDQGPPAREPPVRVTAPNAEQVATLLDRLAADDPWRVPVLVALYTGLRRGELLALRWSAVDLDQARLRVVAALDETKARGIAFKAPKSAAGRRTLSLPGVVVEALREHRQQQLERAMLLGLGRPPADALVFPRTG